MNPLEAFHAWLRQQPEEYGREIAAWLEAMLIPKTSISPDPIKAIEEWNALLADESHIIGRALGIRASFDYQFSAYETPEMWELSRHRSEWLKRAAKEKGRDSTMSESMLQNIPRRRREWPEVITSWRKFCIDHLSDVKISAWWSEQMSNLGEPRRADPTGDE